MKNMIDYVLSEKRTFEEKAFSVVDSLVLSQMAYIKFDKFVTGLSDTLLAVPVCEIASREDVNNLFINVRDSQSNNKLFWSFVESPRFKDTRLLYYVNHLDDAEEKQFSAVTFQLADDSVYLAFRGTDATVIGWKEDLNMTFTSPVPSQEEGTDYVNFVANKVAGKLRLGGHSKGGNIAVYAAIYCEPSIKDRIEQIYSHDGPGLRASIFESTDYLYIKDRINKTIPQSSIIGMLLYHQEQYSVVKSSRILFMQHDPFSWLIEDGNFHYLPAISKSAVFLNGTLKEWLNLYDDQERELFINTLFQVIHASGATSVYDLNEDWQRRAMGALSAMRGINKETRAFLRHAIWSLFVLAGKNIRENDW